MTFNIIKNKTPELNKAVLLFEREVDIDNPKLFIYHAHEVKLIEASPEYWMFQNKDQILKIDKKAKYHYVWIELEDFVKAIFNKAEQQERNKK